MTFDDPLRIAPNGILHYVMPDSSLAPFALPPVLVDLHLATENHLIFDLCVCLPVAEGGDFTRARHYNCEWREEISRFFAEWWNNPEACLTSRFGYTWQGIKARPAKTSPSAEGGGTTLEELGL